MWNFLVESWYFLLPPLALLVALAASAHAVLNKRETVSAIAWVGLIWLAPFLGTLAYVMFGVNRISRRAARLRRFTPASDSQIRRFGAGDEEIDAVLGPQHQHLRPLISYIGGVTDKPLLPSGRVRPLFCGEEAFPPMLEAIESAESTIGLMTYIFDNDRAGDQFVTALTAAASRGVDVKVLIDSVGQWYSSSSVLPRLREGGVDCASFLPTVVPWLLRYTNLRNHRKVLVVDGKRGFTGGMNIREGNYLQLETKHPIRDLHFEVQGPVVEHLRETFAVDWEFATQEHLEDSRWFPQIEPAGDTLARGISEGPDEDFDKMRLSILGAIACARDRVTVMTPYFLPDTTIASALNVAARRGVDVDVILPKENNLVLVGWAAMANLQQFFESGLRVWLSPPPFDHSKLLLVDGIWTLFGSTNWDARSLRLNFEFNVECYDRPLAERLGEYTQQVIDRSERLTKEAWHTRSLPVRLRDGVARLFSPYL